MMDSSQPIPENLFCVVDLITTDEDKKFAPAGLMATAIIAITQEKGDCLPQDLLSLGFTKEETLAQWHMAQAMASVELNLINSEK